MAFNQLASLIVIVEFLARNLPFLFITPYKAHQGAVSRSTAVEDY
jgi:hypothetical protein